MNIISNTFLIKELKESEVIMKENHLTEYKELKNEIATIKGLLINRKSFPSAPIASSIPKWQLMNSSNDDKNV